MTVQIKMGTLRFAHPTNLKLSLLILVLLNFPSMILMGQVSLAAAGRFLEQQSEELSLCGS